jgi:hypothetical protein
MYVYGSNSMKFDEGEMVESERKKQNIYIYIYILNKYRKIGR